MTEVMFGRRVYRIASDEPVVAAIVVDGAEGPVVTRWAFDLDGARAYVREQRAKGLRCRVVRLTGGGEA
jgi:hypothetical protein